MKILLVITIALFLHLSCSNRQSSTDFLYIKVITTDLADTITAYNKGFGLVHYAYYDVGKDSLIYRDPVDFDSKRNLGKYKTYVGRLAAPQYLDTIRSLIRILKRHGNGAIPDNLPEGSTYCDPELYVEYADSEGVHYNSFILDNDTLRQFGYFIFGLSTLPLEKREVSNGMVRADQEVVHAMKRFGLYQERETPIAPALCGGTVDLKKFVGAWRMIVRYEQKPGCYTKINVGRNGAFTWAEVDGDKSKILSQGRYILNSKDSTFVFKAGSVANKYKIEKLTDICFEAMSVDGNEFLRLERLQ
jgi:hypothetical protein